MDQGALLTLTGKTGWRKVEIGRGSNDQSCPVHAVGGGCTLPKIDFDPVFLGTSRDRKDVTEKRLNDKCEARLIKRTVLDASIRSELPEKERLGRLSGRSFHDALDYLELACSVDGHEGVELQAFCFGLSLPTSGSGEIPCR